MIESGETMSILKLHNINKSYRLGGDNSYHALRDINVSFEKGELVSIIGESGSGKSTLMNVIGGLDSDFTGELTLNGDDIGQFNEKQLDEYRKNKVGFIFQSFNLIPHYSILDNVTVAMTLSNVGKETRVKRAKEILKQVGLEDHINKKPNQLSGGQKQRVAIARALINDPDIILADEPTGALDSQTTEQILELIEGIAKRGKLVIMVTHSEKVAQRSSRVIQIADGKIIADNPGQTTITPNAEEEVDVPKKKQNLSFFAATKLAAQNMKEKLGRNVWVSLGASIGIMSVIVMFSLGTGLKSYMSDSLNSLSNPLVVETTMPLNEPEEVDTTQQVQNPMASMQMFIEPVAFEEENIAELETIENVVSIEKGVSLNTVGTNSVALGDQSISIVSLMTTSAMLSDSMLAEGEFPEKGEILISTSVASQLGEDLIGETVELTFVLEEQTLKQEFKVSGYSTMGMASSSDMPMAFITYEDLETLAAANGITVKPTSMYLLAEDADATEGIKKEIAALGYEGSTADALMDIINTALDTLTYSMSGISGISLFVSGIMILVVLHISVVERTKEIGVLKAIGARRKDIKRIFVSEAFLIGLVSGIVGVCFAIAIGLGINAISSHLIDANLSQITIPHIILGVSTSVIISMLSGLLPASKAAKLDPVESLRRD